MILQGILQALYRQLIVDYQLLCIKDVILCILIKSINVILIIIDKKKLLARFVQCLSFLRKC